MTSPRVLIGCLILSLLVQGCGKKKPETVSEPAPAAPTKAVSPDDGSAPAAPPPPPVAASAPAPDTGEPEPVSASAAEAARQQDLLRLKPVQGDGEVPTQKALIWAIDRWEERNPSLPTDVNQLVAKGYLKPLPPPPSGKKYQLDAHNRELTLVNK